MIDPSRTVAIVGRPNVGKSRLFNRLCGRRLSIVHDMPGVTRDLISAEVNDDFVLLDTGGLGMELKMTPKKIADAAEEQVGFAIQASAVILFIVDIRQGITALDEIVAEKLRRYGKEVILVANKADLEDNEIDAYEFISLGLGDAMPVSAEHGRGITDLLDAVKVKLGENKIMRFKAKLESRNPEDTERSFTVSFYLVDNTVQIHEPPRRNSGIVGGSFLSRMKLRTTEGLITQEYVKRREAKREAAGCRGGELT